MDKHILVGFNVAIHKEKQIENQESNIIHNYDISHGEKKSCLTTKTKQSLSKCQKKYEMENYNLFARMNDYLLA